MPTIETHVRPYEFFARWGQDGALQGMQVQRREIVDLGADKPPRERYQDLRVFTPEPLESGTVPFQELMSDLQAAALLDLERARSTIAIRDARIKGLSTELETASDAVKASQTRADQAEAKAADLEQRLAGMEADRDANSGALQTALRDAEALRKELAATAKDRDEARALVRAHETVAREAGGET